MTLDELHEAAHQGVSEAQYVLALCFNNGWGVVPDKDIAEEWLLKSSIEGYAAAQYELALLLHAKGDSEAAVNWLRVSATQGFSPAGYLYSLYCENGIGMPTNLTDSFRFCLSAAENDYSPAARRVASMFEQGNGVAKNPELAFDWYHRAAELGDADAAGRVGLMYAKGIGVVKNTVKAMEWLVEGKKRGSPWALYRLSSIYRHGELGQPVDRSRADELAEQAEELLKERANRGSSQSIAPIIGFGDDAPHTTPGM